MIAGIVIGSIVGAIAIILSVPFYVAVDFESEASPPFRVRLRWLGGAFKRQFPTSRPQPEKSPETEDKPHRPRRDWMATLQEAMTDEQAKHAGRRLLGELRHYTQVDSFRADFRIGPDDPETMAFVAGPAGAASVMLNVFTDYNIMVMPSLDGNYGQLQARFHLRPIRLVPAVMSFITSHTGRQLMKKAVARR